MARGTIDQLNFEVILNDTKFDAQVRKDIALANQLNTSLTNSLNLRKKLVVEERAFATAAAKTATAQQKAQAAIEKSAKGITSSGMSLNRAWLRFSATLWSIVSIARLIGKTIGSWIKNISEFQQANANLATIMQVSRKEVETLTNDALTLGRTTEWTASQVTELQTALAKLGYNIPQIQNMQASVLQFATAVGANLPDAANLAGAALRMFGMHSSEMQKALEILTASTNKTALDFEKLKVALPYAGSIAHSIGFDIAETSALLGVLTNAGLASSRAGTGLRHVLLELSKENGKSQTAMGGNIKTFDDFVRGLQLMRDRGLEAGEAAKLVSTRASSALLILANGVDDIKRLNGEVRDTDGLLKTIQAERLDTLHGSTLLLKSAWEGLIQSFRDSAGPMKDVVDWLTKIIRATSLAASRANRVAQGTKRYTGSDELTKTYTEMYDRLREQGHSEAEAMRLVREQMINKLNIANEAHAGDTQDMEEKWWYNTLTKSIPLFKWITKGATRNSRQRGEAVDAIEDSMDAVMDYISNHSREEAEIAANNYLEEWKLVFDTKGADAARDASDSLIKSFSGNEDMTKRLVAMRDQLDEYIRAGGESGASGRGAGSSKTTKLTLEQKAWIAMMEEAEDWLEKDFNKQLDKNTKDLEKGLDAREKATEEYEKFFKKWSSKDFSKHGDGALYDVTSALADYNTKNNEADLKYAKGLSLLQQKHKGNAAAIEKEAKALRELRDAEKAANKAAFQDRIRGLADDIFKEGMSGYDMTNWAEKTLGQIRDIKSALMKLDVPDSIKEILDDETLTKLEDALQAIVDAKLDNTVAPEEMKALKREAGYALDKVSSLAEALAEVSDTDFGDTIKGVSEIGDIAKEALGAFKEFGGKGGGGTAAAMGWIAAVVALNMKVLQLAAMEEAQARRERSAIRDARSTGRLQDTEQGSFFGVSSTALLDSRIRQINRISEAIDKYRDSAEDFTVTTDKVGFWKKALGWMNMENWRTGSYLPDTTYSLSALAEGLGMQLYDEYGNLNAVTLKAILDSYEDIQEEEREWIEQAIHDSEDYAEAMADVKEMLDGVFGDIASQAADNIIDQWIQAGDAALDYADILDDVARRYAKMLVESAILDKVLNKEEADRIADMFVNGRADEAMAAIAGDMQKIADMEPLFGQIMSVFDPYFNRSSSTGSSSLGSGIKSITEETASLLASYINAIRADVSTIRKFYENGFEGIAAFGAALPTLNDYLAQVSANTYDTAQNTNRILSELQSVIGAPGTSGMVVRVEAS